jgi:PhzF family phenazine biosynthesis protein
VEAIGLKPSAVGKNIDDYLVEIESEAALRAIQPDFSLLAKVAARGVIVTCRSASPEFDFVSRFFAPAVGVNEDPVTGSSHTCLAPYWAEKLNKHQLNAYQASERGGILQLSLVGSRVLISGKARTIFFGELCV